MTSSVSVMVSTVSLTTSCIEYTHSLNHTPQILAVSPTSVHQGDTINITVLGVADDPDYNVLTIGGLPCTDSDGTNTNQTSPDQTTPPPLDYIDTVISCTVPNVSPGDYRLLLHVAGRGWAYGLVDYTTITVSAVATVATPEGSTRGGLLISLPVIGVGSALIDHTTVVIGNTPCPVQKVIENGTEPVGGAIECSVQPARDDGYSSLIRDSSLAYWSLQMDYYDKDGGYVGSEDGESFASQGSVRDAPAAVHGAVGAGQAGISGNNVTDQAVFFSSSYLKVSSFSEYEELVSFSVELWVKLNMSSSKYVPIVSSYASIDGTTTGFIVSINPCNQIEFWLATEDTILGGDDSENVDSSGDDNKGSCEDITQESSCPSLCDARHLVYDGMVDTDMPSGSWAIVTSNTSVPVGSWTHLVFGYDTSEWYSDTALLGQQVLYVNGDMAVAANTTYYSDGIRDLIIGGTDILPLGATPSDMAQVHPFTGYVDEVALYDHLLSQREVDRHYYYGSSQKQPIWISTEYNDGVGEGLVPHLQYNNVNTAFNTIAVTIDWDKVTDDSIMVPEYGGAEFNWNG